MRIEQRVQVQILGAPRPYSYAWIFDPAEGQLPLSVGDKVEIPANQVQEDGGSGTVCALRSDYDGPLREIVRVIKREGDKPPAIRPGDDDLWAGIETR